MNDLGFSDVQDFDGSTITWQDPSKLEPWLAEALGVKPMPEELTVTLAGLSGDVATAKMRLAKPGEEVHYTLPSGAAYVFLEGELDRMLDRLNGLPLPNVIVEN